MSEQIKDGGAAFSRPFSKDCASSPLEYAEAGMTLRDYFAASALQMIMRNLAEASMRTGDPLASRGLQAATAYAYADAMLAAREAKS